MAARGDGSNLDADRDLWRPGWRTDGRHAVNRKGVQLCMEYQTGNCPHNPSRASCPRDPQKMHQCAVCLKSTHGAHQCPLGGSAPPPPVDNVKGKKGRGKGKKGKGKRWQY